MDLNERRRANLLALLTKIAASELAKKAGIAPSTISRYKSVPYANGHKNISEENARKIEAAAKKPVYWLDGQDKPSAEGQAQKVSLVSMTLIPKLTWGEFMAASELPACFKVALPDNAMAPRAPAGSEIEFSTGIPPAAGDGVLVRNREGNHFFRLYKLRGSSWEAHALNDSFLPMDAQADGLEVVAVLTATPGRWA